MKPPAPSDFPERYNARLQKAVAKAAAAAALTAVLGACLAGCTAGEYPDREPLVVEGAPVDTLEFLPPGTRYVLEDSLTPVLLRGYRLGYACTRILTMALEKLPVSTPGFASRIRLQLPAEPECALDSSSQDSVLMRRFNAADGPVVRLLDSLGSVLDSARLIKGSMIGDSLELVGPAKTAFKGRVYYRDTLGTLPRELTMDSLTSCEFLNHAEFSLRGDTTTVRYTWVTLDAAAAPDSCRGANPRQSLVPLPSRP